MQCKVDECGRPAKFKAACLCQKHYFRIRRNGSTDLKERTRKQRQENPEGYQWVYAPDHPLRHASSGYVAEHRAVVFAEVGYGPLACALCTKPLTWATCHIDHIDEDVRNNARSNLRPTCSVCNTRRGMQPPVDWSRTHAIEFDGVRLTPAEWARDPRVQVSGRQIVVRKLAGMSDEEALFAPKRTHNGNQPPARKRPYKAFVYYEHNGKSLTLSEWAREPGVSVTAIAIKQRLNKGWALAEALFSSSTEGATRGEKNEYRARANALAKSAR